MRDQEGKALLAPRAGVNLYAKAPHFIGVPWLALASILSGDTVTSQGRTGRGGGEGGAPRGFLAVAVFRRSDK
jgi:hypothetical protein